MQPIKKSYTRLPLTQAQESQLEGIARLYNGDIRLPIYTYNEDGRRVLIITDKITPEDDENLELFSGRERSVYDNVLNYCTDSMSKNTEIEKICLLNFEAARPDVSPKKNAEDRRRTAECNQIFYNRIKYFISKFKPDVVICAGLDPFTLMFREFVDSNPKAIVKHRFNRLFNVKYKDHKFQLMGTIDIVRPCSWDSKHKEFANLLTYVADGITQALNGKNYFDIQLPKTKMIYVDTMDKFNKFFTKLQDARIVAIDSEGDGKGRLKSKLYSLQFAWQTNKGYFLPIDHPDTPFDPNQIKEIKSRLKKYFEFGKSKYHIYQYGKYDVGQIYAQLKIRFYNHRIYDIQGGRFLWNENLPKLKAFGIKPYALDFIAAQHGCYIYEEIEFSKGDRGNIASEGLTSRFIEYSIYDATVMLLIHDEQIERAKKEQHSKFLLYNCEQISDTLIALAQMEYTGALVNRKQIYHLKSKDGPVNKSIQGQLEDFKNSKAAQKVNKYLLKKKGVSQGGMFGGNSWVFDINKEETQDLLFYHALKLEPLDRKKSGKGKIDKAFLKQYSDTIPEVKMYKDYKAACTLRNNFVNKMFDKLHNDLDTIADGRLRSSYTYTQTTTNRLCLDGNSLVAVLDSRCLVPIKDIREGDIVWSFNKNLDPIPTKVTWQGKTKYAETVTIMYQGYKSHSDIKTLICTPDHPIRLRDGSYKKAKDLKPRDRVMHLERRYETGTGYRYIYFTGMKGKEHLWGNSQKPLEHRLVAKCAKEYLVHHKDEIKDNNVPSNLENMDYVSHGEHHGGNVSELRKKRTSATLKYLYASGKIILPDRKGKNHPGYKELTEKVVLSALIQSKWHPTKAAETLKVCFSTFMLRVKEYEIDIAKERERFNGEDKYITDDMLEYAAKLPNYNKAAEFLRVSYYKAKKLLEADNNHEVIKVTKNEGKRWTYDIEVEKNSNFIANGICVHNSSVNLNLQNLVARGDWAKPLKKSFISPRRCILVKNDYSAAEVKDWCNQSGDKVLANSFYQGLKYRQEQRVLAYSNPDNWEAWIKIQKNLNWHDKKNWQSQSEKTGISVYELKVAAIKKINDPITKELASLTLTIEVDGDVHRLNCVRFFGLNSPLDVTDDQRYDIKAVVFGTIYGKTAAGLAKSKAEGGLGKTEEECQAIIDKLFVEFETGGKWLNDQYEFGKENLYVESPLGMRRHLAGYLHTRPAVINAMNRRAPNSKIQGNASQIGTASIRIMQKLLWHYWSKHNIDVYWKSITNDVHDSVESETPITFSPVYLYLIEHASTTLVHRRFEKVFGYKMIAGLEIEFNIGPHMSDVGLWSWDHVSLHKNIENTIDYHEKELGYNYKKGEAQKMVKDAMHNWSIIREFRLKEIEIDMKSRKPATTMLLTEENARSSGLIIEGHKHQPALY